MKIEMTAEKQKVLDETYKLINQSPEGSLGKKIGEYFSQLVEEGIQIFPAPFHHEIIHSILGGGTDRNSEEVVHVYEKILKLYSKDQARELMESVSPGSNSLDSMRYLRFIEGFLRNKDATLLSDRSYEGISLNELNAHIRTAVDLANKIEDKFGKRFSEMTNGDMAQMPEGDFLLFRDRVEQIRKNFKAERSNQTSDIEGMLLAQETVNRRILTIQNSNGINLK